MESVIAVLAALIPMMQNPDSDRHVLAAAVIGKAQVIVTKKKPYPPHG